MPRHPGIQHSYRMREVAEAMSNASGIIQESYNRVRRLETEAEALIKTATIEQARLNILLGLQQQLLEAAVVTQYGLPSGMANEEFEAVTRLKITS